MTALLARVYIYIAKPPTRSLDMRGLTNKTVINESHFCLLLIRISYMKVVVLWKQILGDRVCVTMCGTHSHISDTCDLWAYACAFAQCPSPFCAFSHIACILVCWNACVSEQVSPACLLYLSGQWRAWGSSSPAERSATRWACLSIVESGFFLVRLDDLPVEHPHIKLL